MIPQTGDREGVYSIHTFVDGTEKVDKDKLSEYIDDMTLWLGKLHSTLQSINLNELDLLGEVNLQKKQFEFEPYLAQHSDQPQLTQMYNIWIILKEKINFDKLSYGIIHGDIGPGANILMENNKVSAIIDIMGMEFGFLMQDIASFVMYSNILGNDKKDYSNYIQRIKYIYLNHSTINESEFKLLPFFLLTRFLLQGLYFTHRIRTGSTQGNNEEEDNEKGFNSALWMLKVWREYFYD